MPKAPKNPATRKTPARAIRAVPRTAKPSHDLIAKRAYELFLERGGEHGHDEEDWLTAERQLNPAATVGDLSAA
jgi:hypothetical protein